jgi:hypothetical protein
MSKRIPPKQRVHRILKNLRCYLSPTLQMGAPPPEGIALSVEEEFLGCIQGGKLESILTDRGAYFGGPREWRFVAYEEIEDVCFPEKTDPRGSLCLRTPLGNIELLSGNPELGSVGRFFMRCQEDANEA